MSYGTTLFVRNRMQENHNTCPICITARIHLVVINHRVNDIESYMSIPSYRGEGVIKKSILTNEEGLYNPT